MNELRESLLSVGVADAEAAVAIHALLGSDPALLAQAGELPQRLTVVDPWVKTTFLHPDGPFLERAATAVDDVLGEAPGEAVDKILAEATVRPRTLHDLRTMTGLPEAELTAILPDLAEAGLLRPDPNPLDPDSPFWTMDHRLARFHYAMLTGGNLERWRRGYITDKLWRMTHARFDRYVCRPEFNRLAREWALGVPAAASATRIVVPDPRFKQMRTLELAVWDADGGVIALGTVRWKFRMVHNQLNRLRHVRRLLGDPPARLYCVAPRVEEALRDDPDPDLYLIPPAKLLPPKRR
jgi:hypothetical protein